ncbi:MAG TPA: ABC transporter substrate-binding protein [Actinomycetota bacterium]|nr:ABC transporter substrate-binding protein [Actinomycetota bacterium]
MRKLLLGLTVLTILAAACAPKSSSTTPAASGSAASCAVGDLNLHTPGQLTIATGNPAYLPWYGGTSVAGSDWKSGQYTGDPHTGKGYESAFAYALAKQMGFTPDQVVWEGIPFNKSFAPGPKDFDFAMQQISITAKREKAVDFSDGYYDVNQALIADNGSPAIGVTTLAGLKDLRLGAPVGTTSFDVIEQLVQPTTDPKAYPDLSTALKAMKNGQIDGVVVDFPDAFYGYADQIVGQFPPLGGQQEQFGLTFEKGNPLVSCVNQAIAALKADGTLTKLQNKWLQTDADVPVFS